MFRQGLLAMIETVFFMRSFLVIAALAAATSCLGPLPELTPAIGLAIEGLGLQA